MGKLNNIQKTIAIFATVSFIILNAIVFVSLIQLNTTTSFDIIVRESNSESQKSVSEDKIFSQNTGSAKFDFKGNTIIMIAPFEFKFKGDLFSLTKGSAFIVSNNLLNVAISKGALSLSEGDISILDTSNEQLILLKGELSIDERKVTPNQKVLWEIDNFRIINFDRKDIGRDSMYKEIEAVLSTYQLKYEELSDIQAPDLTSITPANGANISGAKINIIAKTESGAKAKINDQDVDISQDGSFSKEITTQAGVNVIRIELSDPLGNSEEYIIRYTKRSSTSQTPTSYPISNND